MTQPLRRLGTVQPLCGTGVTSLIDVTSMPVFWIERTAVSRPEPGPLTCTSTRRRPCSMAALAARSAACRAAYGVLLRLPLKPTAPDEAHEITFPDVSVIVTIVLLNELLMWTTPVEMFLRSRLRGRRPPGFGFAIAVTSSQPSSCSQRSAWGPCECGHWCGCAGHGPAAPCDAECPAGSRSRSCA